MNYLLCLLIAVVFSIPSVSFANCLKQVAEFAEEICGRIQTAGTGDILNAEGNLTAELDGLVRRFAGSFGGGISVRKTMDAYENVLREDLAGELQDLRKCKIKMVGVAVAQLCPAEELSSSTTEPTGPRWAAAGRSNSGWEGWVNVVAASRRPPLLPPPGRTAVKWVHASPCSESFYKTDTGANDYCILIAGHDVLHPSDAPYGSATDVRVQVTFRALSTPQSGRNAAGLIFGRSRGQEYRFVVRSDGTWLLDRDEGGNIGQALLGWSPIINYDHSAVHQLKVVIEEDHLYLYVDSVLVADLVETRYRGGGTGIFAWSDDAGAANFAFTDFQFDRKKRP